MPFKSEKQRRYLWANEPEIARDWTDTYGSRIHKNSGGISQLVKPGPGRPGYQGKLSGSELFLKLWKDGKIDNLQLAMEDADRYDAGKTTNYEKTTGNNPLEIYQKYTSDPTGTQNLGVLHPDPETGARILSNQEKKDKRLRELMGELEKRSATDLSQDAGITSALTPEGENTLASILKNDPLKDLYNLDPSVIKSYAEDTSPSAGEAQRDSWGYTRPYGEDPNLFIKDLDKFGIQPRGPLYGAPIMDDAWLDSPAYNIGMDSPGDIGSTSVSGVNRRPQTYREMMHAYLNEGKDSYKRPYATQGMIEDNPTITERNKRIGETIGHEARHQLLAKNPEFYEDIHDDLVANIGATGTNKHEILNRMLDFQAYNDPGVYDDIYEYMHGDMPRHLSSPIADKFYDQSTAFTNKMLHPYGTTLPDRRRNVAENWRNKRGDWKTRVGNRIGNWRDKMSQGISSAWSGLTGFPGMALNAFRGQQLTPQQQAMNNQFFQKYNVGIGTQQNPFQMTSGPFQGMNAPGQSAFGSATSQEMAQKWMDKYGDVDHQTQAMLDKKAQISQIAQGPGDKGQHTTQGTSTPTRPGGWHPGVKEGGLISLWPR